MARLIICKECGEEKEYYARGMCRNCYRTWWRHQNPEKRAAQRRRWYERHRKASIYAAAEWQRKNPERAAATKKREYERNPKKFIARVREWRRQNPEKHAAQNRRYNRKYPEMVAIHNLRRRARKASLPDTLTNEEALSMLITFNCFYCNDGHKDLCLDHFVPVCASGGTTRANMVIACRHCNAKKGKAIPQDYLDQLTFSFRRVE